MKSRIAFVLICAGVLAFACGPSTRGSDSSNTVRTARARAPRDSSLTLSSALDVRVEGSALDVRVEGIVHFDFRVTNVGDHRLEVTFPNGQTHELVVLDSLGREVWRWSRGRMFTQSLQNRVLHASDALAYDARWRDAPPGSYVAVATLASMNYPLEQRAEFVVR